MTSKDLFLSAEDRQVVFCISTVCRVDNNNNVAAMLFAVHFKDHSFCSVGNEDLCLAASAVPCGGRK